MPSYKNLNPLNNWQKNICEYGGLFGILLALTCLIQHFTVVYANSLTNTFIPGYLLSIIAFSLLAAKLPVAPIILIISTAYTCYIAYEWSKHEASSAVVWLLVIYQLLILSGVYSEKIPQKLVQRQKAMREERDSWNGKI